MPEGAEKGEYMMKQRGKLLFSAVVCALMLPLMLAGTAGASSVGDGSKPNAAGLWDIKDYGQCIGGIKADGTMVVDTAHNLSRPDCIDHVYTSTSAGNYDNSTNCTKTSGRTGDAVADDLSHYWSSVCVDNVTGLGVNLDGLDRTAANCNLKAGSNVGKFANACVGSWVYTGSGTSNNPVLGNGAPGFCYTSMRVTPGYADNTACLNAGLGYSWDITNSRCLYAYGVNGVINTGLTRKSGGTFAAAGATVNLTVLNQGQCLIAGASWSTGVTNGGSVVDGGSTIAKPILSTRAGCLECHNTVSQNNNYAERWKEPYLMHGHKNMLRKVTAGQPWAGPDSVIYTAAATGPVDFNAATATIGSTIYPLKYLFGDWMAPAPAGLDVIVDIGAGQFRYNGTSTYSCAACHTTGWSNPTAGICIATGPPAVGKAGIANKAACDAVPGIWYASVGLEGSTYVPPEPLASFPGYTSGITGKWDLDGIICARCHNTVLTKRVVTNPVTGYPMMANGICLPDTSYNNEAVCVAAGGRWDAFGTHNVTPNPNTANDNNLNICFGCHQSIAKTANGTGLDSDLNPVVLPVKNAATVPGAYTPEFNGHVIGGSFLNSPHAKFTGTILPNIYGKYDIATDARASSFGGYVCRSSATLGSGSVLAEVWSGGANTRITTQALCNLANGQPAAANGYWQKENKGACTTCHNVHESLFDPNAAEPLKVECTNCHTKPLASMNHPGGGGTPAGLAGADEAVACELCHMPKATSGGFPMHLWRINPSASYSTFPVYADNAAWVAGANKAANTSPDGAYTNAAWVDVDYACGSCHGGSFGPGATTNGASYKSKTALAGKATNIHSDKPIASMTYSLDAGNTLKVNVDGSSSYCPSGPCTYTWAWGDTTTSTGVTQTHTYATGGAKPITLTVFDSALFTDASVTSAVNVYVPDAAPVVLGTACNSIFDNNTWLGTVVDASTDDKSVASVTVNWGDGSVLSKGVQNGTFGPHKYLRVGTFTLTQTAYDNVGQQSFRTCPITVKAFTIGGKVTRSDTTTLVSGAKVEVKKGSTTVRTTYTNTLGVFSVNNLLPDSYTIVVTKTGTPIYTFVPFPIVVGPDSTALNISATTP